MTRPDMHQIDYDRIDQEIGRDGCIPLIATLALIAVGFAMGFVTAFALWGFQ